MPPVPEFQRARSPEHKAQRREAILRAASELAIERSVREVSLGDIARRVGLAKSNVLRYFETREDVYLRLLVREWESWQVDVGVRLWSGEPTPDAVARTLARTLAERPLLCDLLSQMAGTLERNVSAQVARDFTASTTVMLSDLGELITELLPGIDPADGRETVWAAIVIVAGLWPMRLDFEPRLQHLLEALIVGFLPIEDV